MINDTTQDNLLKSKKPFDPIGTLIRHWLKIVVFGTVLFLFLSPTVFLRIRPYFETSGKIRISPVTQAFMSRNEETSITSYYAGFVETQVDRIKSLKIVELAINNLPDNQKKIFTHDGIPVSLAAKLVQRRLEVTHLRGTHLIEVKYTKNSPGGMADLINSLIEVYIDDYEKEERRKDQVRLSSLQKEKMRVESEIKKMTDELQKYSEDVAVSAFSSNNDQLAQFQDAYEKAYRERLGKENHLKAIINEGEAMKQISLDAHVNDLVENNTLISQLDLIAQKSLQELRDSRVGMAEDNPGWTQVEERMREIQYYTEEQRKQVREKIQKLLSEKRETELQERIIKAEAEYNAAKNIEEGILKKRDHLLTEKVKLSPKIFSMHQVENNIDQMRKQLNKIESRFNEIKLESNANGRIVLENKALKPGSPAGTNMKKLLVLVFLLSFGSISGICALFDILDERIRNNKDVINVIGTPPHRPIADYLLANPKKIKFSRVTLDDPSNKVSRSIYSLAIRLDKERRAHNAQIAVFTGVDSRSGVTEILLNAAHAMSRFCQNVLVIEANFSHPVLDKLTDLKRNNKGLVDFLLGEEEVTDHIISDKERKIDLLFAGHLPTEDEMVKLDRSKIPPLLENLKKQYDFILIDTTPMLASDMTEFLLVQADIVPLVIQGDRSIYKHSYMAGQSLIRLEVPAIAAILNWGAPKYQTQIQRIVFKILLPIQRFIKNLISRNLSTTTSQQNRPNEVHSDPEISNVFQQNEPTIIDINPAKKITPTGLPLGIVLFMILSILFTLTVKRFYVTPEIPSKNIVRQEIIPVVKEPQASASALNSPFFKSHYAYASIRHGNTTVSTSLKSLSEISNNRDSSEIDTNSQPMDSKKVEVNHTVKPIVEKTDSNDNEINQENWIMDQDPGLYTIQLIGAVDREMLIKYVETHNLTENVAMFHKFHKGRDWYSLIFGLYTGWSKAMAVLENLPDSMTQASPWVIKIEKVQEIIRTKNTVSNNSINKQNS